MADRMTMERHVERFRGLIGVEEGTGCWRWLGKCYKGGRQPVYVMYGKQEMPRRLAYEWWRGERLGGDEIVMPTCGDAMCVNPDHMRVVPRGMAVFAKRVAVQQRVQEQLAQR